MKAVEIKQATAPLAEYVRTVSEEPVIVNVKGKPVVAGEPAKAVLLTPAGRERIRHARDNPF